MWAGLPHRNVKVANKNCNKGSSYVVFEVKYLWNDMVSKKRVNTNRSGETPGDGGINPPNNLSMVFICIPSKNLAPVRIWAQVSTWIQEKKCSIVGEDLFFGLYLICSPEKNRGRGSSSPMLKIGQNWVKIANYPHQCSTKICTPEHQSKLIRLLKILDASIDFAIALV